MGSNESTKFGPPVVMGDESIMCKKAHGTSATPVQQRLKWGCDTKLADRICNFNRHYAECAHRVHRTPLRTATSTRHAALPATRPARPTRIPFLALAQAFGLLPLDVVRR